MPNMPFNPDILEEESKPLYSHEYRHFFLDHRFIKNGPRIVAYLYGLTFLVLLVITLFYAINFWRLEHTIHTIQKASSAETFKEALQHSPYKDVYGILNPMMLRQREGFYPVFRALSSIKIENLWLNHFSIYTEDDVIILNGLYNWPDAPDIYINQLITQKSLFYDWRALLKRENAVSTQPNQPAVPNQPTQPVAPTALPNMAPTAKSFTIFLYRQ